MLNNQNQPDNEKEISSEVVFEHVEEYALSKERQEELEKLFLQEKQVRVYLGYSVPPVVFLMTLLLAYKPETAGVLKPLIYLLALVVKSLSK
jgi:hypothetical protein